MKGKKVVFMVNSIASKRMVAKQNCWRSDTFVSDALQDNKNVGLHPM
jgi:hypothetical protein